MERKKKEKIENFSYIRAVACIGIITLHTVFTSLGLYGEWLKEGQEISYRVVINNLMWAVPCFFMVTGALLLDKDREISYKKLFSQYIARILGAIIVFGFVFAVADTFWGREEPGIKVFFCQLAEIFSGKTWSHMWYLYCLIGLYLLLPAYKKIVKTSSLPELQYLLGIGVTFLSIIPALKIWNIACGFYIPVASIYPFYLLGGYYLWKRRKADRSCRLDAVLLIGSTVLLILLSLGRWKYGMEMLEPLFGYSSIFVIVQAVGVYGLFIHRNQMKCQWLRRLLVKIDENSFGIYLIHMILVRILFKQIKLNPFAYGGWPCILAVVVLTAVVSWGIVWGLKKIPVFRKIL